ncbi:cbb3-type cytochrome c oxidase subunit II [Deinococcus marmoris]|uniref:Cytochrome c oxidase subunit CcoO n=1 Tax=Deinococcus marmoris TaxID=249408 RepID=A0A1U7NTK0_9DEIO|nr:cbb3-type cytochrome c oxidase subunit II [Deinococcus marmoris]OLV16231.1 Cytochrome c oxidase subunit CcoO [Deinococcus marmoris]
MLKRVFDGIEGNTGLLVALSLLIFSMAILTTVVLPYFATNHYQPTALAVQYTAQQQRGRQLYAQSGCWECHSQNVRLPESSIGTIHQAGDIGAVSHPGDYVYQNPTFFGQHRRGPDLMHVATRWPSEEWMMIHFLNPERLNPGTWMPSFGYLSEENLDALSAYLMTLK